jgi:hypothetical protein
VERHLERDKDPKERYRSISVIPETASFGALTAGIVSAVAEVTYEGTTERYTIEGTTLTIAPENWRLTYRLAPKDDDDYWRWNENQLSIDARWS